MKDDFYGRLDQTPCNSDIELHVEEIRTHGFSIVENLLNEDELDIYREKIHSIYKQQEDKLGLDKLTSLQEKDLCRMPIKYDDFFINLVINEKILSIVKKILGDYFILNLQNAIINTPNEKHHQNKWHRDLPYQNYVISNPLSINVLFCIDDFSRETGGTAVLPYTHKMDVLPSDRYIKKHSLLLNAKAGSAIVFDSMLIHKAGYNSSQKTRRAVNHMYSTPIMKQFYDFPRALKGKFSEDKFLSQLLGYTSQTAIDDVAWRENRVNKDVE